MFSKFDSKRAGMLNGKVSQASAFTVKTELNSPPSSSKSPTENKTQSITKVLSSRSKSKHGCLTCKVRKKKCEGTKPVCRDCQRFSKECVWIDYDSMKVEEIRRLRMKVKEQESYNKVRIRRPHPKSSQASSSLIKSTTEAPNKANPRPVSQAPQEMSKPEIQLPHEKPYENPRKRQDLSKPDVQRHLDDTEPGVQQAQKKPKPDTESVPLSDSHISLPYAQALREAYPVQLNPTISHPNDDVNYISLGDIHHDSIVRSRSFTNGFDAFSMTRGGSPRPFSPAPMDIDGLEDTDASANPSEFFNFLKEYSAFLGSLSAAQSPQQVSELQTNNNNDESLVKHSLNFNIPGFLDQVNHIPVSSSSQLSQLASAFNAAFIPPPKVPPPVLPELDASGRYLYDYYVNTLSKKVSIAPLSQNESNSYQKVFLPLAQRDKGVLCGILAWAGFHLGGQWTAEASMYAESAVKLLTQDIDFSGSLPAFHEDRRSILNKLAIILILCGAEICRGDVKYWSVYLNWGWKLLKDNGGITKFDNNKEEHWLITNFAYHDVLASSVNERGTYFPLETYQKIFKDPQGVSKGNLNPLLGVSKILYRYIAEISSLSLDCKNELEAYYRRQSPKVSPENFDTEASCSPESVRIRDETALEVSDHGKVGSILYSITARAKKIEYKIDTAKPDPDDLENLNDADLELQLMCFEAYQLSCKLFLRQAILKLNPSTIESQNLMNDLMKCVRVLVETPMQASLVFPLFIAGIHSVAEFDRERMRDILNQMMETYGPWNVVRIKYVMEKVWEQNPDGDKVVDWLAILKQLGWEINFA